TTRSAAPTPPTPTTRASSPSPPPTPPPWWKRWSATSAATADLNRAETWSPRQPDPHPRRDLGPPGAGRSALVGVAGAGVAVEVHAGPAPWAGRLGATPPTGKGWADIGH